MESITTAFSMSSVTGEGQSFLLISLLIVVVLVGIGWFVLGRRANTMPTITPFQDMKVQEGFYGGVARGAGIPDCLRTSSEAAELHGLLSQKVHSVEEGPPDLMELTVLLSQLSCFKKDLMGVAKQVEATRYQPFLTQIDLEPIAETTARCFAKTIPPRDLDLAFDKWRKRGHFLLVRLCTSLNMNEQEIAKAEGLFQALIKDVQDVAQTNCLSGEPMIAAEPAPRDTVPYESTDISGRTYSGYY